MLFRQLFHAPSCTYTYLIASRPGGEAVLIDPVLDQVDHYVDLVRELGLELVFAIDTHIHADHITGLGELQTRTGCAAVLGEETCASSVSHVVGDGDVLDIDGVRIEARHTPGHTDDSYSFVMADRVFTGDTLLIRGTGRTDFQNGCARKQYDSLFHNLLRLPEQTRVYPGHDYKGNTVSTIGEEKRHNPRLQFSACADYVRIMENLKLPRPKLMDIAVPANLRLGRQAA